MEAGYVVRMPKAYPVYEQGYDREVETLRRWLAEAVPNAPAVSRTAKLEPTSSFLIVSSQ